MESSEGGTRLAWVHVEMRFHGVAVEGLEVWCHFVLRLAQIERFVSLQAAVAMVIGTPVQRGVVVRRVSTQLMVVH